MCEQTPVAYKYGDIVWVKLGPCWWPGEVVAFDQLPSDIVDSFKKPPLSVVKFFEEENYEFVKNLNNIYSYNCNKKYEFIKKGLDLHRAKNTFMDKFPSDVCTAEIKTGGNPNILNDPKLTPEKKTDYTSIFGTPPSKRASKESPARNRNRFSFGRTQSSPGSAKKNSSIITHPRFLGKDDHEVRILVQTREQITAPHQEYTCHTCSFKSTRVDVIALHSKSHIKGVYTPASISKKSKRSPNRKPKRIRKTSHSRTEEEEEEEEIPLQTDIRSDLLAEWNDDDDEEQDEQTDVSQTSVEETQDANQAENKSVKSKAVQSTSKRFAKVMKMSPSKTASIDEDLALLEKGLPLCSESSSGDESDDIPLDRRLKETTRLSEVIKNTTKLSSRIQSDCDAPTKPVTALEVPSSKETTKNIKDSQKSEQPPAKKVKTDLSSDDSERVSIKSKRKQATFVKKLKKPQVISMAESKTDITSDLLAEWDDDDEEDEDSGKQISKSQVLPTVEKPPRPAQESKNSNTKSCFDFEEEDDNHLLTRSEEGRKIPRVIPLVEKRRSFEFDDNLKSIGSDIASDAAATKTDQGGLFGSVSGTREAEKASYEEDLRLESSQEVEKPAEETQVKKSADEVKRNRKSLKDEETESHLLNPDLEAFNNILASTAVPKLPEIPRLLKCEQNFHSVKTVKFPDKSVDEKIVTSLGASEIETNKAASVVEIVAELHSADIDAPMLVEESHLEIEKYHSDTAVSSEMVMQVSSSVIACPSTTDGVEKGAQSKAATEDVFRVDKSSSVNLDAEIHSTDASKYLEVGTPDARKEASADVKTTSAIQEVTDKQKATPDAYKEASADVKTTSAIQEVTDKQKATPDARKEASADVKTTSAVQEVADKQKATLDANRQTEAASKLINPKKRFVKTFEDETKHLTSKKAKVSEDKIEEEKGAGVEVSKLKTLLMSKLNDESLKKSSSGPAPLHGKKFAPKSKTFNVQSVEVEPKSRTTSSSNGTVVVESDRPGPSYTNSTFKDKSDVSRDKSDVSIEAVPEFLEASPLAGTAESESSVRNEVEPEISELTTSDSTATKEVIADDRCLDNLPRTVDFNLEQSPSMRTDEVSHGDFLSDINDTAVHDIPPVEASRALETANLVTEEQSVEPQLPELAKDSETFAEHIKDTQKRLSENEKTAGDEYEQTLTEDDAKIGEESAFPGCDGATINTSDTSGTTSDLGKGEICEINLERKVGIPEKAEEDKRSADTVTEVEEKITSLSSDSNADSSSKENTTKHDTTEGNLTVVTESDLADKQVEMATDVVNSQAESKPIMLSSFSMDFCEDNIEVVEEDSGLEKIESEGEETRIEVGTEVGVNLAQDIEENISSFEINKSVDFEKTVPEDFTDEIDQEEIGKQDGLQENETDIGNVEEERRDVGAESKGSGREEHPLSSEKVASVESEVAKITSTSNDQDVRVERSEESTSSSKLLEILTDVRPKSDSPCVSRKSPACLARVKTQDWRTDASITKGRSSSRMLNKYNPKGTKFGGRSTMVVGTGKPSMSASNKSSKPKILSEQIFKPVLEPETLVSVKKVTSKRSYEDVEDIDTYIIQKPIKKMAKSVESADAQDKSPSYQMQPVKTSSTSSAQAQKCKARILQQTIITPAGDIIQPAVQQTQNDDNMFDINSMPIVLDDQILTPESIENMPVVLQEAPEATVKPASAPATAAKKTPVQQMKILNKSVAPVMSAVKSTQHSLMKQYAPSRQSKVHKIYQSGATKLLKTSPTVITPPGKPGKFIIVPSSSSAPTGTKYTVGKRPPVIKRPSVPAYGTMTKVQSITPEPTGNKVMIVTNNLGQQQRVLLTPAQQKMLSYQTPGTTKLKPVKSGTILQKPVAVKDSASSKYANIISQTIVSSRGQVTTVASQSVQSSAEQVFAPMTTQQLKAIKTDASKARKPVLPSQKIYLQGAVSATKSAAGGTGGQRTIIIKNPQGQTIKRIQSSDDSLLEQQVAEQIQAINKANARPKDLSLKPKVPAKKAYGKRSSVGDFTKSTSSSKIQSLAASTSKPSTLPPLTPISSTKKCEPPSSQTETNEPHVRPSNEDKREESKRLPHQLVIQDAQGNQTTITEGQILALPSETVVDGQPQSYVLVTLDETGNLAPLNNEALMSLDPNLNLGSDLGNMILQIDQGAVSSDVDVHNAEAATVSNPEVIVSCRDSEVLSNTDPANILPKPTDSSGPSTEKSTRLLSRNVSVDDKDAAGSGSQGDVEPNAMQAVAINSGNTGQQLIITGDPISTQKFLESLTEGNADLANLLANAEGNILIQAEGQQILINADSENQMLLAVNHDNLNSAENPEGNGNPMFATQPVKNQDILAAALADTDVFQQDQSISHSPSKILQSQLSPNSTLYPIHAGNVLETNSMNSPIMTPLEVRSCTKKIDDVVDILSQVPKNIDLPITITDPNISQTVAQQQLATLMATELPTALELPLAIQDPSMSVTASEMNSPSFVYSLPSLDDTDINQKAFSTSISMPLLTEDPDESLAAGTPPMDSGNVLVATTIVGGIESAVQEEYICKDSKEAPAAGLLDRGFNTVVIAEDQGAVVELDSRNTARSVSSGVSASTSASRPATEVDGNKKTEHSFIDSAGLCAMRGGICNSLSEPPPDMFDFSVGEQSFKNLNEIKRDAAAEVESARMTYGLSASSDFETAAALNDRDAGDVDKSTEDSRTMKLDEAKSGDALHSLNTNLEATSPGTNTDDSCEIPVQPEIVTDLACKNFQNNAINSSSFGTNNIVEGGDV